MNILMVAPEPFFEPRGTPISVYQRLEALSALGYHVDLLTYHVGKDVSFPNVRILRVRKIGFIKHVRIGPSRAKILLDILLFFKAFWMLLWHRYEVIHAHEEAAFFCLPLAMLFRTRFLYDMHSILHKQLGNFKFGNHPIFIKIFEILERWVIKASDAVITVASDLEEYVCLVNPNANEIRIENIALQAFQKPVSQKAVEELKHQLDLDGRIPIVYTGTYEVYQGLEMALECAKIVRKQFPLIFFLFVGAKRKQGEIWRKKAMEYQVEDCTMFLDVVSPEESMVYLAYAAVLISPRIMGTTIPLKMYSYLHSGKPIVATNISAHTQVLNPDIALLVEPTKEAMAEGIIHILYNTEYAEHIGNNAHRFALEHYNYENYVAKVKQIYRSFQYQQEPELPIQI
jgi:glycosyltransferase involved in cell wall biosynthesis